MTSPMTSIRIPFAVLLLAFAPLAWAQQSAPMTTNVEQQMSADQFKAAGLDKLSAKELAALNAWLQQKVTTETAVAVEKAREEGRKAIVEENRGFFDFGSKEPIVSNIAGEFTGFGKGRTYTLKNGQVWEQIEAASLTGVRKTDPEVKITPGVIGVWYMRIKGYNTAAKVQRIK